MGRHQGVRGFLEAIMTVYSGEEGLGVLEAPFAMKAYLTFQVVS